jgi:hypothetical protein
MPPTRVFLDIEIGDPGAHAAAAAAHSQAVAFLGAVGGQVGAVRWWHRARRG